MDRRPILAVALAACLVLAGCAGSGGGSGAADEGYQTTQAQAQEMEATQTQADAAGGAAEDRDGGDGDAGSKDGGDQLQEARKPALIRTGTVEVKVDDYDATRKSVASKARSLGGYVAESEETLHREGNRSWRTGYVVVRVPAEQFSTMLEAAKAEGTVVSERTETRDVSDQLVDLEARLENLRAKRDRLRKFYDRANSTSELLRIEERLSEVQGEIERLKAEKRALEDKVAFSTLRVRIREPEPEPPETTTTTTTTGTAYHEQSVVSAFTSSLSLLFVLVRAGFVTLAYAAPFLLLASVPVVGLVGLWWRRETVLNVLDGLGPG